MEKIEGVPEIDEFKHILDENQIPWIMNKNDIVFCMHECVFIVTAHELYEGSKYLSLKDQNDRSWVTSMSFFDPKRILLYINETYGGNDGKI